MYITAFRYAPPECGRRERVTRFVYLFIITPRPSVGIRCTLLYISFIIEFYVDVLTTHKIHVRILIKIICIYKRPSLFSANRTRRVSLCAVNDYRKKHFEYDLYDIYYRRCLNYSIMYTFDGIYGNVDVLDNTNEDVT